MRTCVRRKTTKSSSSCSTNIIASPHHTYNNFANIRANFVKAPPLYLLQLFVSDLIQLRDFHSGETSATILNTQIRIKFWRNKSGRENATDRNYTTWATTIIRIAIIIIIRVALNQTFPEKNIRVSVIKIYYGI